MDLTENPIGIYEKALPPFSEWEEALEMTREFGYDFLELSIDESEERLARLSWSAAKRKELRRAIDRTGVPVRHLCLSAHRKVPFASSDSATRDRAWEMMHRAMELCTELGVRILQTQGHDVYYEESTDETWQRYMEGLAIAAEMGREASVMIGLENADIASVGSVEQAAAIIDEIGNPWFQMYPDIGNIVAHGYDLVSQLTRATRYAVAIHIKDARPGEFRRVPFGEGTVPFDSAFAAIRDMGYRGPFVIEMWNDGKRDGTPIAREALRWVRERMGTI